MITCQQCNQTFTATNKRGPRPKFCSNACKQAHYRKTTEPKPVTTVGRSAKTRNRDKLVTWCSRPATTIPHSWDCAGCCRWFPTNSDWGGYRVGGKLYCRVCYQKQLETIGR